jgi:hypothetical protein
MFLKPSSKFNFYNLIDNLTVFQKEYIDAVSSKLFLDYSSVENGTQNLINNPINQNYYWQVYPLWYKFNPWPGRENLKTIKILESLEVRPLQAAFSKLLPNTLLPWHEDHDELTVNRNDTSVIKYHLTLSNSDGANCGLEHLDESRILKEGDLNIFDESKTHRAYNYGTEERGVLLISFLRSDIY